MSMRSSASLELLSCRVQANAKFPQNALCCMAGSVSAQLRQKAGSAEVDLQAAPSGPFCQAHADRGLQELAGAKAQVSPPPPPPQFCLFCDNELMQHTDGTDTASWRLTCMKGDMAA